MKNTLRAALFATMIAGTPLAALADSGFFVSGSVGSSTFEDEVDGFRLDTDTTAYRLTAGLQVGDYFGIEGGYHSFGEYDESFDIGGGVTDISIQADEILKLLQVLNREHGKTIVMVTHDAQAADYANRTLLVDKGTLDFKTAA